MLKRICILSGTFIGGLLIMFVTAHVASYFHPEQKPKNPFISWAKQGYESVDYYAPGVSKPITLIPGRWGLFAFDLQYGNVKLEQLPTEGLYCIIQDNGVMWCDVNGLPTRKILLMGE